MRWSNAAHRRHQPVAVSWLRTVHAALLVPPDRPDAGQAGVVMPRLVFGVDAPPPEDRRSDLVWTASASCGHVRAMATDEAKLLETGIGGLIVGRMTRDAAIAAMVDCPVCRPPDQLALL